MYSGDFDDFAREHGTAIQHALVAALGVDVGVEAASEALAYGWQHWERVSGMTNPAGYLYKVGRNWGRRRLSRRAPVVFPEPPRGLPWIEPGLPEALASLTERQRVAVTLVHGGGWSLAEVSELLGITRGAVAKHVDRALASLARSLGVDHVER